MNPAPDHAPDYGRGFLRVPLSVWQDLYCRAPLTRRQLQLVSLVIRESWGWQKKGGAVHLWTRPLPIRHIAQATGLSSDHLTRDLKVLVARGVLREQDGRYQLVPNSRLWKTPTPSPLKLHPSALKSTASTAEAALPAPDLKTAKITQRNVLPFPGDELSPVGDNSRVNDRFRIERYEFRNSLRMEDRFLRVVAAFVGGLSARETEQLHTWVRQEGVLVVWEALAVAFGRGPTAVRHCLEARLGKEPETAA